MLGCVNLTGEEYDDSSWDCNAMYGIRGTHWSMILDLTPCNYHTVDAQEDILTTRNLVYGMKGDVIPYIHVCGVNKFVPSSL